MREMARRWAVAIANSGPESSARPGRPLCWRGFCGLRALGGHAERHLEVGLGCRIRWCCVGRGGRRRRTCVSWRWTADAHGRLGATRPGSCGGKDEHGKNWQGELALLLLLFSLSFPSSPSPLYSPQAWCPLIIHHTTTPLPSSFFCLRFNHTSLHIIICGRSTYP